MNEIPRYAIYYAPTAEDPVWKLGSEWLGRDAYTGKNINRRNFSGISDEDIDRLTASPARYGFHATLKAPFRLQAGQTEANLIERLDTFAQSQDAFDVNLEVQSLGQFVALRLMDGNEAMTSLHTSCVIEFDDFRAPMSEADIQRRRRVSLSPRQDERMLKWGYPYIFDDFRWHMTLSSKITSGHTREKYLATLSELFGPVLAKPHTIGGVAIYRQVSQDAHFKVLHRSRFKVPADPVA